MNAEPSTTAMRKRDAVRVLFIIDAAGETLKRPKPPFVKVLKAELKLQALDFWIRNPDYLAWEMLQLAEENPSAATAWGSHAQSVMSNKEPEIRRIPMLRYLYGAWEARDDALSILESVGLIHRHRKLTGTKVVDTQYFLTEDGQVKAQELSAHSALKWYADRAQLVAEVGGSRSGTQLKKRQHKIAEYHETLYHVPIPPIETEVRKRLAAMEAST